MDKQPTLNERELVFAKNLLDELLRSYENFGQTLKPSTTHNTYYDEMIEFVNLRMQSAKSAATLLESKLVGDALTLCRPMLENYLLFRLMASGKRYFRIQEFPNGKAGTAKLKAELMEAKGKIGKPNVRYLDVRKHPRNSRALIYIYEGLYSDPKDELIIPIYFFYFQNYDPMIHRLNFGKYFNPIKVDAELRKAFKSHKESAKYMNEYFLSFSSILDGLNVNNLVNPRQEDRIQAHYTFLGSFVHPTNRVARDLHERSNVHSGKTGVGLEQPYSDVSILLGYLYLLHLVSSIVKELVLLYKNAPAKYVAGFDSSQLDSICQRIESDFGYFWFIDDGAPAYDKFNYAVNHKRVKKASNFKNIPDVQIPFDKDIYGRLSRAINGWKNSLWGEYSSPLDR